MRRRRTKQLARWSERAAQPCHAPGCQHARGPSSHPPLLLQLACPGSTPWFAGLPLSCSPSFPCLHICFPSSYFCLPACIPSSRCTPAAASNAIHNCRCASACVHACGCRPAQRPATPVCLMLANKWRLLSFSLCITDASIINHSSPPLITPAQLAHTPYLPFAFRQTDASHSVSHPPGTASTVT